MGDLTTDAAKRFLLMAAALLATIAAPGAVRAHPEESHEADAPSEPPEAGEATEGSIASSQSLRFADRRQVLFRLGFGGKYRDAIFGTSKPSPTFGATLRWDRPVHEYATTGIGFSRSLATKMAQSDGKKRGPARVRSGFCEGTRASAGPRGAGRIGPRRAGRAG